MTFSGDLGKTMLRKFCMGQNLRALLSPDETPPVLHDLLAEYQHTFNSDNRGTLLNDTLAFDLSFKKSTESVTWTPKDMKPLPTSEYVQLVDWYSHHLPATTPYDYCSHNRVFMREKVQWLGQMFQTNKSSSFGDSKIVFSQGAYPKEWSAGCIRNIFSHTRTRNSPNDSESITQTFVLVDVYSPLLPEHEHLDHYRVFPMGGHIFYERFEPRAVLMRIDDILGHFGYVSVEIPGIDADKCLLAKPFVKVSASP